MKPLIATCVFALSACIGSAATINVSNYGTGDGVTEADVEAAIAESSVGDVIQLSAGSATWTSVALPTGRTLNGAGISSTIITSVDNSPTITLGAGANQVVANLKIVGYNSTSTNTIAIQAFAVSNVRIHHVEISNITKRGIAIGNPNQSNHPTGVIDNCTLTANTSLTGGAGTFQLITVYGGSNVALPGASTGTGTWKDDPGAGSSNAVFVEDCVLSQNAQGDSTIETYEGGKVVVRYNTIQNFMLGVHGHDSSNRSGHWVEIYENTVNYTDASAIGGFVFSRGGSGVVWNNTITANTTGSNGLYLQLYRAAGNLNADYTLRFPYTGGQLDGSEATDGNTAVANGTGTHSGGNNASTLTDSTKSWASDFALEQGVSNGTYATNDTLQPYYIWNRTDGSGGFITGSTGTTISATLSGGTDNDWDTGDEYVITFGYPGLDQNGWTGPTVIYDTYSTQQLNPWYQWGNTYNALTGASALPFAISYTEENYTSTVQPDYSQFIQENREFYNNTERPDYIPYTYPHPLRPADAPTAPNTATLTALRNIGATIAWTDASDNEEAFEIDRSTDNSTWAQVASISANSTSYDDRTALSGTTYYYRVRAVNGAGDSTNATPTPASITTGAPAPVRRSKNGGAVRAGGGL